MVRSGRSVSTRQSSDGTLATIARRTPRMQCPFDCGYTANDNNALIAHLERVHGAVRRQQRKRKRSRNARSHSKSSNGSDIVPVRRRRRRSLSPSNGDSGASDYSNADAGPSHRRNRRAPTGHSSQKFVCPACATFSTNSPMELQKHVDEMHVFTASDFYTINRPRSTYSRTLRGAINDYKVYCTMSDVCLGRFPQLILKT